MLKTKQVTWLSPEQYCSRNRAFIFSTRCAHAQRYVVVSRFFSHKGLHSINATFVEKYRLRYLLWVPLKATRDKWSRERERPKLQKSYKSKNMNNPRLLKSRFSFSSGRRNKGKSIIRLALGEQNLNATCPKGKLEFNNLFPALISSSYAHLSHSWWDVNLLTEMIGCLATISSAFLFSMPSSMISCFHNSQKSLHDR